MVPGAEYLARRLGLDTVPAREPLGVDEPAVEPQVRAMVQREAGYRENQEEQHGRKTDARVPASQQPQQE